ncbi:MAG: cupin domain-containing protein [Rhizobiaceae bacterium]
MPGGPTADQVIARLGLKPHPEGGWFSETFRDNPAGGRGHSTAIYFLLREGEQSAWHRVRDAAEVWHFYAGGPLSLEIAGPDGAGLQELILGPDLEADQRPQHVVPANWWQRAQSRGAWTLVGCTVAPGFDFTAFEMAEPGWEPAGA